MKKIVYFTVTISIIILGLISRKITGIPLILGDILWAMMMFFLIALLLDRITSKLIFVISLVITYLIEISQLYHSTWIDTIRATKMGHLVLGQGFLWTDLVAYFIGIVIGCWLKEFLDNKMSDSNDG